MNAIAPQPDVQAVIQQLLTEHNALTLATTGGEFSPWVLGVYFAAEGLTPYLVLEQAGKTMQNVKKDPRVALLISSNDASKDFVQASARLTLLPDSELPRVMGLLTAKMPWFKTYTPTTAVRLDVTRWHVSSLSRGWFPARVLTP